MIIDANVHRKISRSIPVDENNLAIQLYWTANTVSASHIE